MTTVLPSIRQLVFLAGDLKSTVDQARAVLGLKPGVADSEWMAERGFVHEVFTIETTFLEFTAPTSPDTMPGRLVARGGDAGFMVVVQVNDLAAVVARAKNLGIAPVAADPYEGNPTAQWHPRDFGTLAEFDQILPPSDWHMEPQIFDGISTDVVGDFTAVELSVKDPQELALRWATVLDVPLADDKVTVDVSGRQLRFVASHDGRVGLTAVEFPARQADLVGTEVSLSGVQFRFREMQLDQ